MTLLILGLVLFLGTHSIRIFADPWRSRQIARWGALKWKAAYTLLSLLGLVLLIHGYGLSRFDPLYLWQTPVWTRHLAALLTLPAFVLLAAAYLPAGHLRKRIGHPMLAGVKLWALAHLLANNTLADLLLFGSFLAWAVIDFAACRRRDRLNPPRRAAARALGDILAVVVGLVAWMVVARHLHAPLFGVAPFG
jgi:uncharacterized membrane protein